MIDVARIDHSATSGDSWLHRRAPNAKLVAFVLILASVVIARDPRAIGSLVLLLGFVVVSADLPRGVAFGLAAYPSLFALVFALASASDLDHGIGIILKAVTAALAAVIIVLTTPYPQIFAPIQRVVPGLVGDTLLMTYRSTFLLLEKFGDLLRTTRLRAGLSRSAPLQGARAIIRALGSLVLYSFDLAQRDYDVLRLRGYENGLRASEGTTSSRVADMVLVIASILVLLVTILIERSQG